MKDIKKMTTAEIEAEAKKLLENKEGGDDIPTDLEDNELDESDVEYFIVQAFLLEAYRRSFDKMSESFGLEMDAEENEIEKLVSLRVQVASHVSELETLKARNAELVEASLDTVIEIEPIVEEIKEEEAPLVESEEEIKEEEISEDLLTWYSTLTEQEIEDLLARVKDGEIELPA